MACKHIEETIVGRIVLVTIKITVWLFISVGILPTIFTGALISGTSAFWFLFFVFLYTSFKALYLFFYDLVIAGPKPNSPNNPEFQEAMARYSRHRLHDSYPSSPCEADGDTSDDEPYLFVHRPSTLPSTTSYLRDTRVLPNRRWSTETLAELPARTFWGEDDSDDGPQPAKCRIDKESLALARRTTMEERARARASHVRRADGPGCDRSSSAHQLHHADG